MYVIGITGPSGAGKTTASHALETLGAITLDCDNIYHKILATNEQMTAEICGRFGDVASYDESASMWKVDRYKLREVVFNDPGSLRDLNEITHKYVWQEVNREISRFNERGGELAAIDAVALIESNFNKECDMVVGVLAPVDVRVKRIVARDGVTADQARKRVSAQQNDDFYRTHCDYIIENPFKSQTDFMEKCIEFFTLLT